ncbi:DEAD/DEAH box helicase, partial [Pseudomonas fluorescens]
MSYSVAVRALCEFTAKVGDLDLRFTPSPSAQEGIVGHRTVASRRSAHYQHEVALEGEFQQLRVRGRADGYDPDSNRLEEVKTYRGDLDAQPANHRQLHWAQVKVYGWLMCQKLGLHEIDLALVYFDIVGEGETLLNQRFHAAELERFFNQQCALFLGWAREEMQHRDARNSAAQRLAFPHAEFRPGQRALAESVYKAVSTGRCLMAQAPTGIGKTVGTLFPMLKALAPQQLDKVFFLTAKTPGRKLALDAAQVLFDSSPELALRVLELVARDKACEHLDKACHGDSCPLAKGFYDRLPAARTAASKVQLLDQRNLRDVALAHDVCPYYLSQEMARWTDLVVADYNYYFDFGAMLFGLAQLNQWRAAVLVDEAHNLVERARAMYSASLDQYSLHTLRDAAPEPLKKPLQRLNREWNALHKEQLAPYQAYATKPDKLLQALSLCTSAMGDHFNEHPEALAGDLQAFYFEALQFAKVAELFNEQFIFDISKRQFGG